MNDKLTNLLRRRPVLVAVVSALMGFVVVDGSRRTETTSNLVSTWPKYVSLGLTVYVTVAFFASFRVTKLAGPTPESARWALAFSPVILCGVWVPLTGGPTWLAWSGLGLSWLLLGVLALSIKRLQTAA